MKTKDVLGWLFILFVFTAASWQVYKIEKNHISRGVSSSSISEENLAYGRVQEVFNNRCVVCHSCNNAPCQLNLTSFEGLRRGANKLATIDPERIESAAPTRLGIDATTEKQWRQKGFFAVLDDAKPSRGILSQTLQHKNKFIESKNYFWPPAQDSHSCPVQSEAAGFLKQNPHMAMPYGLPPIEPWEQKTLEKWLALKAPGPDLAFKEDPSDDENNAKMAWEYFLNQPSNEKKLVARYLYEHLFLAHIHFSSSTKLFFRLVRSQSSCDQEVIEVPTRRPYDKISKNFFYCFKPINQTIVEKTHMPYLLDLKKLDWMQKNFFSEPWTAKKLPSYDLQTSANPFVTFEDIPVKARYQFLLEDAHYHVATFIKGPVCNGNKAVNSIDDQFYIFFTQPQSDLMVRDSDFLQRSKNLLVVPAEQGSDASTLSIFSRKYIKLRNNYREQREQALQKNFPKGLSATDIWNGDGYNQNSVLTVFRHSDNSYVLQGARGDASHSAFVLDYALFERLVYNLVVGYDIYGDITHQFHTRTYMGLIRMEGESNFLDYFPTEYQEKIYEDWHQSTLAELEKAFIEKKFDKQHLTQIFMPTNLSVKKAKSEMYQIFLQERNLHSVKVHPDILNWKSLILSNPTAVNKLTNLEKSLDPDLLNFKKISSIPMQKIGGWMQWMPDLALLVVKDGESIYKIISVVRNKAHDTVGSLFF
ncbi:MAG: fatty acid cis/trans isomerase, partial [Pseudobdellovibrionaceae bacterium]